MTRLWDRFWSMPAPANFQSNMAAFLGGIRSALISAFFLVLAGTYIGMGALAHGFGMASWWLALSTVLVWAAPAQVILISALGVGAPLIEVAIAVSLSAVRLFPMVVALLPLLRAEGTRLRDLLLPAQFTSVSMRSAASSPFSRSSGRFLPACWPGRARCCWADGSSGPNRRQ